MTRSYIHTPMSKQCGSRSEQFYKRQRAHQERQRVRQKLHHQDYDLLEFELTPWNEWVTNREGKLWAADWFNGQFWPYHYWDRRLYGAFHSHLKQFDPRLAKKRRSK